MWHASAAMSGALRLGLGNLDPIRPRAHHLDVFLWNLYLNKIFSAVVLAQQQQTVNLMAIKEMPELRRGDVDTNEHNAFLLERT